MGGLIPKERLSSLRGKIDEQRNTIQILKLERHDCPDAERQLSQIVAELQAIEFALRQSL